MMIEALNITVYDRFGMHWHNELRMEPTWDDIKAAIHRLDQFQYPFVWLYRTRMVEEDTPYDFNIIGGNGIYAFDGRLEDKSFLYIQPDAGDDLVHIWTSDQGFEAEERYVCRDLAVVLQATNYFCFYGKPDPTLTWEWRSASHQGNA